MDDVFAEASHLIGQQIERMIDAKFRDLENRISEINTLDEEEVIQIIERWSDVYLDVEDKVREVLDTADFEVTVTF